MTSSTQETERRRPAGSGGVAPLAVDDALERARSALLSSQRADGHWCYELEADCTIPAEYVLMMHYMDEVDGALERRLARYLRQRQQPEGGWPLYHGGRMDVSCTVKAYYALKLAGDDPDAAHMRRAREAVLARGGAARSNVFTRIALAQFAQIPWSAVPFLPVELVRMPRRWWMPIHLLRLSYWSRTVVVPLLVLYTLRRQARNPRRVGVRELFVTPPELERRWFQARSPLNRALALAERAVRSAEPVVPWGVRRRALADCEAWILARLNGDSGLGAIFPAMVNAYEALDALGYGPESPERRQAKRALELLLAGEGDTAYCQPCVSPVWDTALATHALEEAGGAGPAVDRALRWLAGKQLTGVPGDWHEYRPHVRGGGWAFQYRNDAYPDLDDTSAVAWAMHRADPSEHADAIQRAAEWVAGMQSSDGGFAAFDADNTAHYLNELPFADHGALIDPPTEDVTARGVVLLTLAGARYRAARDRALAFLSRRQRPDGSWWGRWGTNHVYGTWSVLMALEAAGVSASDARVVRAAGWLASVQNGDGGFGESNDSYQDPTLAGHGPSTPEQTAWAVLGLLAAGRRGAPSVERGVAWLLEHQGGDGRWHSPWFNAPGFPRVFYLHYHGYATYFPLWALARYRKEQGRPA